jgi:hypothetical protein
MVVEAEVEVRLFRPKAIPDYPFWPFMRRTHVDEFPQFYNVIKAICRLVGPVPNVSIHKRDQKVAPHICSCSAFARELPLGVK